ncbi:MAG TPA: hypothetical protein VFB22_15210 [Candidatus Baltobacteraceae bacterium]|nr:hypothetical protein [Candidatus Baltobacteraceae bacterium]
MTSIPPWVVEIFGSSPETDDDLVSFVSGARRLRDVIEDYLAEAETELERRRTRRRPKDGRTILDALQDERPTSRSQQTSGRRSIPIEDFSPKPPAKNSTLSAILRALYANPSGVELAPLGQRLEKLRVYKDVENATRSTATNLNTLKNMGWLFSKPRHGVWALKAWPASIPPPEAWPEAVMS